MSERKKSTEVAFRLTLDDDCEPLIVPEESREAIAKELYEIERSDFIEHLRLQAEAGTLALRSLILINGGAIVGILTFLGNQDAKVSGWEIRWAIGLFVLGLAAAVAAPIPSYLAQLNYRYATYRQMMDFLRLRLKSSSTNDYKRAARTATWQLQLGLVLLSLSLIFFVGGAFAAIQALVLPG